MEKISLQYGLIECQTRCNNCGGAIQINGPLERKTCLRCGAKKNIPRKITIDLIETMVREWIENDWEPLEAASAAVFSEINYDYSVGRQTPCCRVCKEYFSNDDTQNSSNEGNWDMTCLICGTVMSAHRPPAWLKEKFDVIEYVYNAQLDDSQSIIIPQMPAISNVIYPCPKCSNPLDIDGADRLVHCSYCDHNIYLPDDLWQKLYPPKESKGDQRWYIGFRELPISPEQQREMLEKQLEDLEFKIEEYASELPNLRKQHRDKRQRLTRQAEINDMIKQLQTQKESLKLELENLER